MTAVESRHLGEIRLDEGVFDTTLAVASEPVPFRLEIDHPDCFDDTVVANVDLALDGLLGLDTMARATIAAALRVQGSAATRLRDRQPGVWSAVSADEFAQALRLLGMTMLPDGGRQSPDRVTMTYGLPDGPAADRLTVRFLERTGPQLDPVARDPS